MTAIAIGGFVAMAACVAFAANSINEGFDRADATATANAAQRSSYWNTATWGPIEGTAQAQSTVSRGTYVAGVKTMTAPFVATRTAEARDP